MFSHNYVMHIIDDRVCIFSSNGPDRDELMKRAKVEFQTNWHNKDIRMFSEDNPSVTWRKKPGRTQLERETWKS